MGKARMLFTQQMCLCVLRWLDAKLQSKIFTEKMLLFQRILLFLLALSVVFQVMACPIESVVVLAATSLCASTSNFRPKFLKTSFKQLKTHSKDFKLFFKKMQIEKLNFTN